MRGRIVVRRTFLLAIVLCHCHPIHRHWALASSDDDNQRNENDDDNDDTFLLKHNVTNNTLPKVIDVNEDTLELEDDVCNSVESRWTPDNVREVLSSWNFDTFEQSKFQELQQRLYDINHWKNDPAELARFIKEHNFDVNKAEEMFRGMIEWRRANQIDTFMERYVEPPAIFHYAPIFLLKGLDKEGDPIFVQRIGKLDGWGLYQQMGESAMLQANQFVSELHTSREYGISPGWRWQTEYYEPLTGRRVTQFSILVDLEGLSHRLLRPPLLKILQRSARVAQDHYPGLAKRVFVVRAPKLFQMAWAVAKHFYDPRVHRKFIFSSHDDYLEVLSEYMDLDVLPSVLYEHGHGQPMPGWFENIHMEGGPVPPPAKNDGADSKVNTAAPFLVEVEEDDRVPLEKNDRVCDNSAPDTATDASQVPPDLPTSS